MTHLLRSLIHETLLLEEVYGAQATVYHGTRTEPQALISALLKDEFKAGVGVGASYGKGLYTVYDIKGTKTGRGDYGDHVIKLKVNLYGYIIFDPEIVLKVYKKLLTPAQQAKEVGYSETVIHSLEGISLPEDGDYTSDSALVVSKELQHKVKGLVFTGRNDGRVVVIYDPTTAVPMAWKRVVQDGSLVFEPWTPVDRASLLEPRERLDISDRIDRPVQQSTLRRSAMGDFEVGKWDLKSILKRLTKLPKDRRIVKGDLDINDSGITSLPEDLQVEGDLKIIGDGITSLPRGLKVRGDLMLTSTSITSLPDDLKVDGGLNLIGAHITTLPKDLQVGGYLNISYSHITSLPDKLQVDGDLSLSRTPITSLPDNLKVDGDLSLSRTPITSLPDNLQVGGNLYLSGTFIISLPKDLQVAGNIYGLNPKYWNGVPRHLKDKLA